MAPERRPGGEEAGSLAPQERRKVARAAALRPLNVVVLVVGVVFFAVTQAWWALPLTGATYAALIFLGAGDPILQRRVLSRGEPASLQTRDVSPERRSRWLPRGETRQKVEAALVEYRKVITAIEESDDVTRTVLDDTLPRLHAAADRLVDVAQAREKAAETAKDLRKNASPTYETGNENLAQLEDRIEAADAEISATSRELLDLRAKIVRVSIDTGNADRAKTLNASLDDLNARLEALGDIAAPRNE